MEQNLFHHRRYSQSYPQQNLDENGRMKNETVWALHYKTELKPPTYTDDKHSIRISDYNPC
jgi:hypothetical protein